MPATDADGILRRQPRPECQVFLYTGLYTCTLAGLIGAFVVYPRSLLLAVRPGALPMWSASGGNIFASFLAVGSVSMGAVNLVAYQHRDECGPKVLQKLALCNAATFGTWAVQQLYYATAYSSTFGWLLWVAPISDSAIALWNLALWNSTRRSRAVELLQQAKAKAHVAKEHFDKQIAGAVSFVRSSVNAVAGVFSHSTARVLSASDAVKAAALHYAAYLRAAIAAVRTDLSLRGVKACVVDGASAAAARCDEAKTLAADRAAQAAELAKAKASELGASARAVAADPKFQVSAASAASGAVALGASGGTAGLAAGGALGAAAGLVPAVFTLGLSIPIGAAIGGVAGLFVGTAVGSTVGAVGGGAAGYGVFSKKEDIGKCAEYATAKAAETTELVKGSSSAALDCACSAARLVRERAYASAGYVAEKASAARSRLVGRSGTGGTEPAD